MSRLHLGFALIVVLAYAIGSTVHYRAALTDLAALTAAKERAYERCVTETARQVDLLEESQHELTGTLYEALIR